MILGLLALNAAAQEDAATQLHDAMLREALDGDLEEAVRTYQRLARNLPTEEPARTQALYRWGLALADLGRLDEAREALQEGVRSGACPRCRGALEELEIERHAVSTLPTVWTFDDAAHGVFHPIDAQTFGAIRLEVAPEGRSALLWQIDARPGVEDHLVFALASGAKTLHLVAMSQDEAGLLGVRVEDHRSRRYATGEPLRFPAGTWTEVVVELADLAPQEPDDPRLDPARVVRVELVDHTGLRRGGPVTWWIDRVEVR